MVSQGVSLFPRVTDTVLRVEGTVVSGTESRTSIEDRVPQDCDLPPSSSVSYTFQ